VAEAPIKLPKSWTWPDFLTTAPPPSHGIVTGIITKYEGPGWPPNLVTPELVLDCTSEVCGGDRVFTCTAGSAHITPKQWAHRFLTYECRNCGGRQKVYAVGVYHDGTSTDGRAIKFGEWPPFGPPVPARVIALVGLDRDLFLQGRRAENHSLGMGAFAYYRRVVENQKNRLLEEIIKVSERVGVEPEVIATLRGAMTEQQFAKAVEQVKDAIPESLKIKGHNPLSLLHKALSQNLHERTDQECLDLATDIRVVLTELAERIGRVLQDQAELDKALARLQREINPQAKKPNAQGG
jgi:hypothetical protein